MLTYLLFSLIYLEGLGKFADGITLNTIIHIHNRVIDTLYAYNHTCTYTELSCLLDLLMVAEERIRDRRVEMQVARDICAFFMSLAFPLDIGCLVLYFSKGLHKKICLNDLNLILICS